MTMRPLYILLNLDYKESLAIFFIASDYNKNMQQLSNTTALSCNSPELALLDA